MQRETNFKDMTMTEVLLVIFGPVNFAWLVTMFAADCIRGAVYADRADDIVLMTPNRETALEVMTEFEYDHPVLWWLFYRDA